MKRFFFSAITLMLAAASCTESGIIDEPHFYGGAIIFDTYIGKTPVTKAVNWGANQLKGTTNGGVQMYAFLVDKVSSPTIADVDFDSAHLNGRLTYSTNAWKYQEIISGSWTDVDAFWPNTCDLAFAGYSLNVASDTYISNVSADKTLFDFTVNDNVASQVDLLVTPLQIKKETPNADTEVTLNFQHVLSRVGFKVLPTNATATRITIHSVKLCGTFPKKGLVDLKRANAKITPYTENNAQYATSYSLLTEDFSLTGSDCEDENDNIIAMPIDPGSENRYMMIMPGKQSNAFIEVEYTLGTETQKRYSKLPLDADWEFKAGYAYEFVFRIATAAIEFEAEIVEGGWDEQEPVEKPL